jgi:hypothetical protein
MLKGRLGNLLFNDCNSCMRNMEDREGNGHRILHPVQFGIDS